MGIRRRLHTIGYIKNRHLEGIAARVRVLLAEMHRGAAGGATSLRFVGDYQFL